MQNAVLHGYRMEASVNNLLCIKLRRQKARPENVDAGNHANKRGETGTKTPEKNTTL